MYGFDRGLARTEHVKQPQGHRVDAVGGTEDQHRALLHIFRQRVDGSELDRLAFVGDDRGQRGAEIVDRIP